MCIVFYRVCGDTANNSHKNRTPVTCSGLANVSALCCLTRDREALRRAAATNAVVLLRVSYCITPSRGPNSRPVGGYLLVETHLVEFASDCNCTSRYFLTTTSCSSWGQPVLTPVRSAIANLSIKHPVVIYLPIDRRDLPGLAFRDSTYRISQSGLGLNRSSVSPIQPFCADHGPTPNISGPEIS
jgi:hypothetical protein